MYTANLSKISMGSNRPLPIGIGGYSLEFITDKV